MSLTSVIPESLVWNKHAANQVTTNDAYLVWVTDSETTNAIISESSTEQNYCFQKKKPAMAALSTDFL